MRTEEILTALGTGIWSWDTVSGRVTVDAEAARLLGLPEDEREISAGAVRARFHGVDYIALTGVMELARAEGTVAEARLRVLDERGRVVRVVLTRMRPWGPPGQIVMAGICQEVVEPPQGSGDATSQPSPSTSDWRLSREAFLLDAGRALAEARSTEQVMRVAGSLGMPGFTPNGMAVFRIEGDHLAITGFQGYTAQETEPFDGIPLDAHYPAALTARTGRAIYLPTRRDYEVRFPDAWKLAKRFTRQSWAFLPLVAGGRSIGAWMASYSHPTPFTPDERSVLTTVARMLAQALSRARVLDSERALSAGLQRSMMPEKVPATPGLTVAARYVPTGGGLEIGGDWYDVIALPSGRTALVIGDVQGHDVRAAGIMSQLRIAIRAYASEGHRPDAVLTRASRFLTRLVEQEAESAVREAAQPVAPAAAGAPESHAAYAADPRFATCLYIEADPVAGTLTIARAGHLDPAIALSDGTLLVRPTAGGLPLGVEEDPDYPTTALVMDPGETMLLCSDGLIETGGHDLDTGRDRLRRAFKGHAGEDLETIADVLIDAVSGPHSHELPGPHSERREDDVALVLVSRDITMQEPGPGRGRQMHLAVPQAEQQRTADARHDLRGMLHDWTAPDQVDAAELLLSELVANVLLHTDSDARIAAVVTGPAGGRTLRLTVSDTDTNLPHRRHPGEMASSGRGVLMLEALSDACGVEPEGDGKAIWCEFHERDTGDTGEAAAAT